MTEGIAPQTARVIDGRAIADRLLADTAARVAALGGSPVMLRAIAFAPDAATKSYLRIKERSARRAGIELVVHELPESAAGELTEILSAVSDTAVLVQLPLPSGIDRDAVLAAIPIEKDADVLSPAARAAGLLVQPVAAAVMAALAEAGIDPHGMRVAVVGEGWLVGAPVAAALRAAGAEVTVSTAESGDLVPVLSAADIVVSGAGVPNLITKAAIRSGAVVIDAGTSELGGRVVGDVAAEVVEVAAAITPVPGGIGPIAVACLMANVVTLAERARRVLA